MLLTACQSSRQWAFIHEGFRHGKHRQKSDSFWESKSLQDPVMMVWCVKVRGNFRLVLCHHILMSEARTIWQPRSPPETWATCQPSNLCGGAWQLNRPASKQLVQRLCRHFPMRQGIFPIFRTVRLPFNSHSRKIGLGIICLYFDNLHVTCR